MVEAGLVGGESQHKRKSAAQQGIFLVARECPALWTKKNNLFDLSIIILPPENLLNVFSCGMRQLWMSKSAKFVQMFFRAEGT
jgi:hypothetical protein